jgi:hypothetical protein
VLALDADQRLTPELRRELESLCRGSFPSDVDGYYVCRRQVFRGRWIRHGGYYPKYLLKLFRTSRVNIPETDLVDHHFCIAGSTRRLGGDLIEHNMKEDEILFWLEKHLRYAELQAREEGARPREKAGDRGRFFGSPDERIAWLKERYRTSPLYVRPFAVLAYRLVLRAGFLDGAEGLLFHFLQGFWYRLVVDVRIGELRRAETARGKVPT